jgi:hypothetical protein
MQLEQDWIRQRTDQFPQQNLDAAVFCPSLVEATMLPARPLSGLQRGFVRGLYGYDIDQIFCEQHHALIYHGRRKADGLPILIKLLRDHEASDWGADWFERDYQIAQGLGAAYVATPLAFDGWRAGGHSILKLP